MTKTFKIEGMSCGHCVMAVKKELSRIPVEKTDVQIGKAVVEFDEKKISENDVAKAIKNAGYEVSEVK